MQSPFVAAFRWVDTSPSRPRWRLTLDYNAIPRWQIGLEVNLAVGEVLPRVTYVLSPESEHRPQIHINTSSDRIGTPKGYQQVSFNMAKAIPGTRVAPYVAVTYSGFEDALVFPFGVNWQVSDPWGVLVMNDGRNTHLLVTHSQRGYFVQGIWAWFRRPGITVGFGF